MHSDPPSCICIAGDVHVPMHAYHHLQVIQGNDEALLNVLRAFWRSRAQVIAPFVLPQQHLEM
jgi:hypothetical protein